MCVGVVHTAEWERCVGELFFFVSRPPPVGFWTEKNELFFPNGRHAFWSQKKNFPPPPLRKRFLKPRLRSSKGKESANEYHRNELPRNLETLSRCNWSRMTWGSPPKSVAVLKNRELRPTGKGFVCALFLSVRLRTSLRVC